MDEYGRPITIMDTDVCGGAISVNISTTPEGEIRVINNRNVGTAGHPDYHSPVCTVSTIPKITTTRTFEKSHGCNKSKRVSRNRRKAIKRSRRRNRKR